MPWRPKRFMPVRNLPVDKRCMMALQALLIVAIPIAITSIAFSAVYAWIQAREYSYTNGDWQRCLTAPNLGAIGNPTKQHIAEDSNQFAGSVASLAGRAFVFLIISFKAVYMGIRDHDLLPYSVWVSFFALIGQIVYREGAPIQPEPKEMSATLITLTTFIRPDMYDGIAWAPGVCETAYRLNAVFVAVQYCKLAITFCNFFVAFYAAVKSPRRYSPTLVGASVSLWVVAITISGYLLTLLGKETVALDTLYVLRNQEKSLANIFPFRKADMDILSATMMLVCGTILVGVFHECTEKFKLAAAVSILHVALAFPVLCGTFAAYSTITFPWGKFAQSYSMWDTTQCMHFIGLKNSNPDNLFFGFDDQLRSICRNAQMTLVGQFIIALSLVLQACVSLYIVWANRSFRPPLALTRCRTCADRREDAGSCPDIDYEPTMAFTPQPGGVPHWGCSHSHVGTGHHHHNKVGKIEEEEDEFDDDEKFEPLLPPECLYRADSDGEELDA